MDVGKKVIEIISEQLNLKPEDIKLEHHLVKDLKADSLDIVEFTMSLEEAFNLQIPDDEVEKLSSLNGLVKYIKNKQS